MQNISLIFYGRFPSEKAASLFAAKSCESFAGEGVNVTLIVPRRIGRGGDDPFKYYGVRKNFSIVYLPIFDFLIFPIFQKIAFQIGFITFSISCFFFLLFRANKNDIIYSNESLPIFLSSFYFPKTLYEVHDFPEQKFFFYKWLFRRLRLILVTNTWKMEQLVQRFGVSKEKIICERNAVEIKYFDIPMTKEVARKKLGLPTEGNIVMYTGHLYSWKGVDTLAQSAILLSPDTLIVFVGGTDADVKRFKGMCSTAQNVKIIGHRVHSEIPLWQKAADVLVLPNTAKEDISKYYTSPMKLFEYMASQRPIVASNIPSIAEVLGDSNSVLVTPDDPKDLARGISELLKDTHHAKIVSDNAYSNVLEHSWGKRAKRILNFIN
jgi:glycosyltransferase involved in cell wall biosynthesis